MAGTIYVKPKRKIVRFINCEIIKKIGWVCFISSIVPNVPVQQVPIHQLLNKITK